MSEPCNLGEILWPEEGEAAPLVVAPAPLRRIPVRPGRPPQSLCPACQAPLPAEARFCGQCGHALVPPPCPACHQATVAGARFCKYCGYSLKP